MQSPVRVKEHNYKGGPTMAGQVSIPVRVKEVRRVLIDVHHHVSIPVRDKVEIIWTTLKMLLLNVSIPVRDKVVVW